MLATVANGRADTKSKVPSSSDIVKANDDGLWLAHGEVENEIRNPLAGNRARRHRGARVSYGEPTFKQNRTSFAVLMVGQSRLSTLLSPRRHVTASNGLQKPTVHRLSYRQRKLLASWIHIQSNLSLRPPDKSDQRKIADTQLQSLEFTDSNVRSAFLKMRPPEKCELRTPKVGPKRRSNLQKATTYVKLSEKHF